MKRSRSGTPKGPKFQTVRQMNGFVMQTLKETVARAILMKKPDAGGMKKPWPLDGKSPTEQRTFMHDPPASFELCFVYADAAIAASKSAPPMDTSQHAEMLPQREPAGGGADTTTDTEGVT